MNVNIPSLDASAHYTELLDAANEAARIKAQDLTASRAAVAAIKAIAEIDLTPAVVAQLCAVLSNRVAEEVSWSHWPEAIDAAECLDNAHDWLAQ